ncbi:MAG: hypothetical protein NXH95_10870 [Pseudomonadaceae bacterium]|nr:hypothetical protein [Pseudomonadaceae bacterium]
MDQPNVTAEGFEANHDEKIPYSSKKPFSSEDPYTESGTDNSTALVSNGEQTFTNLGSLAVDADSDGYSTSSGPVQSVGPALNADLQDSAFSTDEAVNIGEWLDPESLDVTSSINPPVDIGPRLDADRTVFRSSERMAENRGDPTLTPPSD